MRILVLLVLGACACPSVPPPMTAGAGSGSAASVAAAPTCDSVRGKVDQLYRAEAQATEPKRVDDAVADNVHMVMADCAKDPAKVTACVDKVQTVDELEKQCLTPLDDEGTEGQGQGQVSK